MKLRKIGFKFLIIIGAKHVGPEQIRIPRDFQIPDTSSVSGGNEYQIYPIHRISDLELVSGYLISEFSHLISDFSYLVSDFAISATGLYVSDSDFLGSGRRPSLYTFQTD